MLPTLLTLVLTKLRKTTERAIEWLAKGNYKILFLALPEDMTNFVNHYMVGEVSREELWQSYIYLTGLQDPYVNALRYTVDPLLDALHQLKKSIPRLEVYCYHDLEIHMDAHSLLEKSLLLETSERARRRIKISAWRDLFEEQLELTAKGFRRIIENISFHAERNPWTVVLYGGVIESFKRGMEAIGFKVKIIHLHNYWRSPLEVLERMAQHWGIHNLSDDAIARCVEDHMRYLDYVLSSQDIDLAHEKWVSDTLPKVL